MRVHAPPLRLVAAVAAAASIAVLASVRTDRAQAAVLPIRHVVVIYQENHSFNDVLGWMCTRKPGRCEGTETGTLPDGSSIDLQREPDVVPDVGHGTEAQHTAIDGGWMDGFATIPGCSQDQGYRCYARYQKSQIPNLAKLAQTYAISDHTFELSNVPSWGAHLELVAGQLDGFTGNNPRPDDAYTTGPGWGCDSYRQAFWRPAPGQPGQWVPSCVPAADGSGPYEPSPVAWTPTIMDRLDAAGLSWRIYAPGPGSPTKPIGYGWAICPSFAECLDGPQSNNVLPSDQVMDDATAGALPSLSLVIPSAANSQHNGASMQRGDNWIGSVVNAVMQGPDWNTTAIFITYDDCGCFYDEVPPPAGLGIRVPMVIVSPYAKPGYTDTNDASFASLLAFTEHAFGLSPLASPDANAYDFSNAFDFLQPLVAAVKLVPHPLPERERAWLRAHPPPDDAT